ncbi:hypothetical protein QTP70_024026, partial [Hemibagrus guttatus]
VNFISFVYAGTSTENYFFYNSTKLKIAEKPNTLECSFENDQCYVECTFVNLTSSIMNVIDKNVIEEYGENDQIRHVTIHNNDRTIKKVYIRAEKKYIDFLMNLLFNGTTKNYDLEEFNMSVFKMDMINATDRGYVQIPAPKTPGYDLPLDVFLPTKPFIQKKFGILTYPSVDMFLNDPKTVLKSKVIRVETVGHEIKHLSELLFIKFTGNSSEIIITENPRLQCRFYNVDATAGLEWDNMGSFTDLENFNSSNTVICSYDHMTPFAVLLVDMNVTQISAQQWKILSSISYVGCSLSSFFSAVTVFLYTFMKSSVRDTAIRIHVSLSVAIFLLNTSFLLTEWAATWPQNSACVLIAVIIQYSLLSCFSWMAIEALHLYLLLIKVFNTYIKRYMIKLSLFGWGVPAVLVGGSLCVYGIKPFYGTTRIKLSNTNETMNLVVSLPVGLHYNEDEQASQGKNCKKNTTCNVMTCESAEMIAFIPNMDVTSRKKLQETCSRFFASDKYIRAEKYYINQLINLDFGEPNTTYEYENFKMTVVKMHMMNATGGRHVKISAPKLSDDDPPIHVYIPTEPFLNISVEQCKIGVVTYPSAQQFINDSNILLKSKVIRIESVGCEIKNFSNQLVINFPMNSSEIMHGNYKLSCQFYDEKVHRWKEVRSDTNLENSNNTLNCSYNHMSLFAVFQVSTESVSKMNEFWCTCFLMSSADENFFYYNSTKLKIEENLTTLLCNWEDSPCYVECISVNLTTNITGVKNITTLVQNSMIAGQNITQLDFSMGEKITTCNVTKCELSEMSTFINTSDLTRLIKAQKMCNISFPSEMYLKKEKEYIDKQISSSAGPSYTYEYDYENFKMTVFKIDKSVNISDNGSARIYAPKWSDQDLPIDVFFPNESLSSVSNVGIVRYGSAEKFKNNSNTELKSQVIRVETVGKEHKNLTKNLVIIFPVSNITENNGNYNLSCMFYDDNDEQNIACNVTKCEVNEINTLITNSSGSLDLKDLKKTGRIKQMCKALESDSEFKKTYITAEKKYIHALISSPFNETSKNYDLEEFNMTVVKMDMMNTTGLVQISAPEVPDNNLTLEVFVPTKPFENVPEEQHKVAVVTYPSATHFMVDNNTQIKSKVIRIEVVGHEIKDLSNLLIINFTLKCNEIIPENYTLSCQFYNDKVHKWEKMGSFTNLENYNSSSTVKCSYDHMTPFAVLLAKPDLDSEQWKILSSISYIGCSLSSFFSAVTIFLYTFMKSSNRDTSIRIHVSLSVAIFLLNTSFLFTEWAATWPQNSACVLIAVIIQYSLLSCFSWMAIEALHLYLLLIKVFNTYIKHYMIKLSLFGWGVPAVLVGGSLCVYNSMPFYGTTEIILVDTNSPTKFCWITDIKFLYGMNITYFCIMFLFNISILVAVTRQICKLRHLNIRGSKPLSRRDICTVLGLTLLLGMTWGLIFFTSGYTNYPILYLFCICNTLQGFILFLWFYGTTKTNKKLVARSSTMSEQICAPVKNIESSFSY